jgi:hypothetical protein
MAAPTTSSCRDLDAAGDSAPGSIVELRAFEDAQGERRVALAVRSDLDLEHQVNGDGRDLARPAAIAREPVAMSAAASAPRCGRRCDATRGASGRTKVSPSARPPRHLRRNLIDTLRRREVEALARSSRSRDRPAVQSAGSGEYVAGTYRQRFALASGRFAMIDDGLGFQLVPWSPSLEKQLGRTSPASPATTAASTGASAASAGSASNLKKKGPSQCPRPKSSGARSSSSS